MLVPSLLIHEEKTAARGTWTDTVGVSYRMASNTNLGSVANCAAWKSMLAQVGELSIATPCSAYAKAVRRLPMSKAPALRLTIKARTGC